MKKVFLVLGWISFILAPGCAFDGGSQSSVSQRWPLDRTLIDEIDAAAGMTFEQARIDALTNIASRPRLSAAVQIHLVQTVMGALVFDSSKQQVLLALINNPYFVREGKQAVLDQLDEFAFEGPRQTILQALNRRGILPAEAELKALRSPDPLPPSLPINTELTLEFQAGYISQ